MIRTAVAFFPLFRPGRIGNNHGTSSLVSLSYSVTLNLRARALHPRIMAAHRGTSESKPYARRQDSWPF